MRVRLTRRLAERIDDIDLSRHRVGDLIDLSPRDAAMLIAEGWAVPSAPRTRPRASLTAVSLRPVQVDARRPLQLPERLREISERLERCLFQPHDHRRAEDRLRDQCHDEHARVLNAHDRGR
jgi:hypothetical protein